MFLLFRAPLLICCATRILRWADRKGFLRSVRLVFRLLTTINRDALYYFPANISLAGMHTGEKLVKMSNSLGRVTARQERPFKVVLYGIFFLFVSGGCGTFVLL